MEVLALVGASGTGKSYRALLVAYEEEADVIIDDALIIHYGHVVAGESAKKQPTRVGAIRAALFADEQRSQEARQKIAALHAQRVLILGTSERMVHHIASRLGLPPVSRILRIEDVSRPGQIALALKHRQKYGRHVIPAPSLEIKPGFSGILLDPLRIALRRPDQPHGPSPGVWVEQSVVQPTFTFLGHFYITNHALENIIRCSCHHLPGLTKIHHVRLEQQDSGLILTLEIAVRYGVSIPAVARRVQEAVQEAVELMTALNVLAVHIRVTKLVDVKQHLFSIAPSGHYRRARPNAPTWGGQLATRPARKCEG